MWGWSWLGELFILMSGQDGEMSSGHIIRVATIKLTNVYIVAIIRILVIENSDDMCVVKGLHLATPAKSPNGFCLQELISLEGLKFEKSLQMQFQSKDKSTTLDYVNFWNLVNWSRIHLQNQHSRWSVDTQIVSQVAWMGFQPQPP